MFHVLNGKPSASVFRDLTVTNKQYMGTVGIRCSALHLFHVLKGKHSAGFCRVFPLKHSACVLVEWFLLVSAVTTGAHASVSYSSAGGELQPLSGAALLCSVPPSGNK